MRTKCSGEGKLSILASDLRVGCVTGNVFLLTVIPQEGEMPIGMLN